MAGAADRPRDDVTGRLGSLFDTHHQRLYRLARRLSRSTEDARDLVQETFLRAARSPDSIPEGVSREEAWLVRMVLNADEVEPAALGRVNLPQEVRVPLGRRGE